MLRESVTEFDSPALLHLWFAVASRHCEPPYPGFQGQTLAWGHAPDAELVEAAVCKTALSEFESHPVLQV